MEALFFVDGLIVSPETWINQTLTAFANNLATRDGQVAFMMEGRPGSACEEATFFWYDTATWKSAPINSVIREETAQRRANHGAYHVRLNGQQIQAITLVPAETPVTIL